MDLAINDDANDQHLEEGVREQGKGSFEENGRKYQLWHAGQYLFPIDEDELDRLDTMHKLFLVARRNSLHSTHISLIHKSNVKVLDLGCGTGIWALDMAKQLYHGGESFVHGIDMSIDMQPSEIYPNTKFEAMDIEEPWLAIGDSSYHLIHARMLSGSILIDSRHHVYSNIFSHLTSGGWLEQVEVGWFPRSDEKPIPAGLKLWADELHAAMDQVKRPLRLDPERTKQILADVGFDNIRQEVLRLPGNDNSENPYELDVGR